MPSFFMSKKAPTFFHVVFLSFALFLYGVSVQAAEQLPNEIVQKATDEMLSKIDQAAKLSAAEKQPYFYRVVSDIVAPMVDFDLIAKRVMGKNYGMATESQRLKFSKVFRETLINTYAKGIAGYAHQKIILKPFAGVQTKNGQDKALIEMDVKATDGSLMPVSYALFKNPKGEWKLENMILNGVNLGLTFRNQFAEAVKTKGNLDQAINNWTVNPGT